MINTIETGSKALAYNTELDRRKPINGAFIKVQVESLISERLHALLIVRRYDLKDGILYGEGSDEPFTDVIKRGIHRSPSKKVDWPREEAELTGFYNIQNVLGNAETPVGTMMLSISPPGKDGSIYENNFYDVFVLREDHKGKHIELRRYSSALSLEEYADKLGLESQNLDDVVLLANPIKIDLAEFRTADEIHEYLHKEHGYISVGDFKKIIQICTPFIQAYIRTLIDDDDFGVKLTFNAILNRADIAYRDLKKYGFIYPSTGSIEIWGNLPVREAPTGCGSSGGVELTRGRSPFSVSEFGLSDKYGSREFDCPNCGKKNVRPENQLIKNCQNCGSSKVAC